MNLIGNSRQAIEQRGKGGVLRLSTMRVGESRAFLEVGDDGAGIPDAILARYSIHSSPPSLPASALVWASRSCWASSASMAGRYMSPACRRAVPHLHWIFPLPRSRSRELLPCPPPVLEAHL